MRNSFIRNLYVFNIEYPSELLKTLTFFQNVILNRLWPPPRRVSSTPNCSMGIWHDPGGKSSDVSNLNETLCGGPTGLVYCRSPHNWQRACMHRLTAALLSTADTVENQERLFGLQERYCPISEKDDNIKKIVLWTKVVTITTAVVITAFLETFVRIYVWWSRREKDHPLRRVKGYTKLLHLSKKGCGNKLTIMTRWE